MAKISDMDGKTVKNYNVTGRYAAVQFFFWVLLGDITGFSSVFLLAHGFSNARIGMLIALACTISVFVQPVIAGYADKSDRLSVKSFLLGLACIQTLCGLYMAVRRPESVVEIGVLYCIMIIVAQVMNPLVNALGTECMNREIPLNFGVARGIGSLGYAVLSYSLGAILAAAGADIQPVSVCLMSVVFGICVWLFPSFEGKCSMKKEAADNHMNPIRFFGRYRRFGVMLIGCTFVYTSHMLINNFVYQIVVSKGGTSREVGIAMAIAAMAELPVLFLFSRMLKVASCGTWLHLAGIVFTLKAFCTLLAENMTVYYLVQLLQMLGWGVMAVASVYFVNSVMEKQDAVKGQAYLAMTYTLGCVLGSVIGGRLIDISGVNSMLIFATAAGFIGMVIMMLTIEKK